MWYNTVEFYVIAGAVAAAAIVAASVPARRKEAVLHLVAGSLGEVGAPVEPPAVSVEVDSRGVVHVTRTGLRNVHADDGAVSLAVNVIGFDVNIEERITPGCAGECVDSVTFDLDFFAPERYHIKYNSEDAGVFAAFTLNASPGIRLRKPLR